MNAPILCATDFSPGSTRAVAMAARVAEAFGLPMVLAHVTDLAALESPEGKATAHEAEHTLRARLEARRDEVQKALAVEAASLAIPCEMVLLDGRPSEALIEYASHRPFSMVVIGAHGEGSAGVVGHVVSLLFGSTAERLLRVSTCPVLVTTGRDELGSLTAAHWEVAVGEDEVSQRALDLALRWADRVGATLHIRRIVVPSETAPLLEDARTAVESLVLAAHTKAGIAGPPPRCFVEVGEPADIVAAHSGNAALVIVGTHARSGLERLFEGSVADRVLRASAAPVLIVPEHADLEGL